MLVIGIAGGTGSGKTTVVEKVLAGLPENQVAVLSQDSYYKDNSHLDMEQRRGLNFDHPDSLDFRLLTSHILRLKQGKNIQQPVYSFLTCAQTGETRMVVSRAVILLEGILILTHSPLRQLIEVKIFLEADADDRLERLIMRDIQERGRSREQVLGRWEETVNPMHLRFIEPSKRHADIIIPGGGNNPVAVEMITAFILNRLNAPGPIQQNRA